MVDHNPNNSIQKVSSDANPQKRYSAKELGEMMNTSPLSFPYLDMGWQTEWYNEEFIEDVFRHITDVSRIQGLMRLITVKWQRQIDDRHEKVVRFDPVSRSWIPYVENLPAKLDDIFNRVLEYRKHKEEEEQLTREWLQAFSDSTQTDVPQPSEPSATDPSKPSSVEKNETKPPCFADDSTDSTVEYHLANLPADVRSQILISEDEKYTVFVGAMRGPVKKWIDKHRLQDWNVVRFICRLRNIVAKHCSMKTFGSFLEHIGLENQENNMKQRKDANDNNALTAYDDSKGIYPKFFNLRKDGKQVEELLADVIEYDESKMSA